MHRDTVIEMILLLVKEVDHRNDNDLLSLVEIEKRLLSLKDKE